MNWNHNECKYKLLCDVMKTKFSRLKFITKLFRSTFLPLIASWEEIIEVHTYSLFGLCSPFGISNIENSNFTRSRFCASCMPYMKYLMGGWSRAEDRREEKRKTIKSIFSIKRERMKNERQHFNFNSVTRSFVQWLLTCKLLWARKETDNLVNKHFPSTPSLIISSDRIPIHECERHRSNEWSQASRNFR